MKAYKFKVASPEQSERLQKVLFEMGYSWTRGSKEPRNTEFPHIFADANGSIKWTGITGGFSEYCNEECDTEEFIAAGGDVSVKKDKKSKWHKGLPPKFGQHYLVWCSGNQCKFVAYVEKGTDYWKCAHSYEKLKYEVTLYRKMPKNPPVFVEV